MRASSGEIIKIMDKEENSKIRIENTRITCAPLLAENWPMNIIGLNIILEYPKILSELANKLNPSNLSNKCNMISHESRIWQANDDLFKSKIDEYFVCTAGRHAINTQAEIPICERGGRVPINIENTIKEEITKNLRLGIIRESNSPWCSRIVMVKKPDNSSGM